MQRIALSLLICALVAGPMRAQQGSNSSTLSGTVLDQAGKALDNATVVAKNTAAGTSAKATSGSDGHFSVTGLSAGTYTVETSAPGFALNTRLGVPVSVSGTPDIAITMNVDSISQSVTVQESVSLAVDTAPQGNTLDATSARTEISSAVITQLHGPGCRFRRGDSAGAERVQPQSERDRPGAGQVVLPRLRRRPVHDDVRRHSRSKTPTARPTIPGPAFPRQWISSTDFDRSPGQASDFGPTNFGGSINLKSPELQADPDIRGTFSYGSFNTKLYSLDFESGLFGPGKKDSVLFNINAMTSDGYQTYNYQQRDAGYGKFQHRFSDRTSLSLYGGVVDIWNNTPNTTNPTRAQVAQYGDNYLLDSTPLLANGTPDPYYYGYNTYHVQTDFEYAAFNSDLGNGWKFDTKAYTTRYWNKQFYQNGATVSLTTAKPSGVDKLNGYRHAGRHRDSEQGIEMGHVPHGRLV